ncbi:MAG TPA: ABC transporter substrate-binding protein [Candidatus Lustribacter sp.]|jgi:NitT/TauT family transport system substrate-binding protein|nr:ABC transporter substrate-binding protein [Candidatus Lustribacter sp.]
MKRSAVIRAGATIAAAAMTGVPALAQTAPVRMETTPVDSAAEPYYGYDGGFFKAAGLDVDLQSGAANGAAISAAVAAGALDVGVSNIVSIVQARAKGIPFVIIGPGGLYTARTPSTLLIVPNGSAYRTASDLNGKTVAVNTLRGLPQYGVQAWIDKNGGRSESVQFTEIGPLDMIVALRSGRIDAGAFVEPFATAARSAGRSIGAPFDAIAPSFLITCWFATLAWAQAHREIVAKLQGAIAKTAAWSNRNHAQSGAILMKYAKLNEDTLKTMLRTVFAERLDLGQVQPVIDLTAKYGGIPSFRAADVVFAP